MGLCVLSGIGTVLTHLPRTAVYVQAVWEIRQETGTYLAPMWQESNFWQASLHCLLAASTKQICQLFGQFCRNIILGVDVHTVWMHTPPSSEQFFLQSIHPSAIHYPKRDIWTWHRGDTSSQAVWGAVVWHGGTAGPQPSTAPGCPSLHPSPHPSAPALQGTLCFPSQFQSRCQVVSAATLQETRREWHKPGQGLVDGGLSGSRAGRGWGTVRCAQAVLGQPAFTTAFKFFHFQPFPLQWRPS